MGKHNERGSMIYAWCEKCGRKGWVPVIPRYPT